ncbi:MAG: hypothetical protein AB7D96_10230 [Arcobacteraceae bacterium]
MNTLPLNKNELETLSKECRNLNVFPIFLQRYLYASSTNPIVKPLNLLVNEGYEYLSIMDTEEIKRLVMTLPSGIRMQVEFDDFTNFTDEEYLKRIALYHIVHKLSMLYNDFEKIIKTNLEKNIVLSTYPELANKLDKDGLLVLDQDFELHDSGIIYKDHVLHYHQFLRRGYTSNPNFDFLGRFLSYYHTTNKINGFRIAIDMQRIMPKAYLQHLIECDAWFGPNFDAKKLDDQYSVGLTVKKRIKPSIFDLTNNLDRTEFLWTYKDDIKTFEIEEISDAEYKFDRFYFNKYIHAERDIQKKQLRHFDGAVKVYTHEYDKRLKSQLPNEYIAPIKIKLFRIDGNIDIDKWIDLISHFFKGNEMILEYFDPNGFEEQFGQRIREYKEISLTN